MFSIYKIYPSATASISDQPFGIHFRSEVGFRSGDLLSIVLPLHWPRCINGGNVMSSQSISPTKTYLKQWVSSHVPPRDSPETACIDMRYGLHRPGLGISDRLDSSFQPRVSTAQPSHLGSTSIHMAKTKHYWATSVVHKQEADRS